MKFSYKFNNLLGALHKSGNVVFSVDGYSVYSPVGNRISVFNLKENKSRTLSIESKYNFTCMDINKDGNILLAINERGEAHFINLATHYVLYRYRFKGPCRAVKFSPNGKHFAVCKENKVFMFKTPGLGCVADTTNAFVMERVFHAAMDDVTCLSWSFDSEILASGSNDMNTRLCTWSPGCKFRIYSLTGHSDVMVGCFFFHDDYGMITVSRDGLVCVWKSLIQPGQLHDIDDSKQRKLDVASSDEDDDAQPKTAPAQRRKQPSCYTLGVRQKLLQNISAVTFHSKNRLFVCANSTGEFSLYEVGSQLTQIHSLTISDGSPISTLAINATGDWLAVGSSEMGQLLVWEWQSETYIMRQQGHAHSPICIAYSADGQFLASGGHDGKLKLWNLVNGFCFVTFDEHKAAVKAVQFCAQRNFVITASLDGTCRAYDYKTRYRNFRTFTSPRPGSEQFVSVAVDHSGELVVAGAQDHFDIYLWSIKMGHLLEILSGHEGPVAGLAFSPNQANSTCFVSVSWDKTLKIWDAVAQGGNLETIELTADGMCVAFKPDGQHVAVGTLDGQISFFDVKKGCQLGSSIEGRNDMDVGRTDSDLITAGRTQEAKSFTTLCYSVDGEYLLCAGQSKNVCIYNITGGLLMRKFVVTQNHSLDAVESVVNRRFLTEFGTNVKLLEERQMENDSNTDTIALPGVRDGDMAARRFKPEVRITSVQFSPTGEQWAAATTEGLLIYALCPDLVFDPCDLHMNVTYDSVKDALQDCRYTEAIQMALQLNEQKLVQQVIGQIPIGDVELIIRSLTGPNLIQRLLMTVAHLMEYSKNFEFYLIWCETLLDVWGHKVSSNICKPALLTMEKALVHKYDNLSKLCDFNKYTSEFVLNIANIQAQTQALNLESKDDDEDDW